MDKTERKWLKDDVERFGLQPGSPTSIGFFALMAFSALVEMATEWSSSHWLAFARHVFWPLMFLYQLITGMERRKAKRLIEADTLDAVLRFQRGRVIN